MRGHGRRQHPETCAGAWGVALRRGHNLSTSISGKIEKDGALARRFDLVVVKELIDEAMLVILRGIRPGDEVYHGIRLTDEALRCSQARGAIYRRACPTRRSTHL